LARFAREIVINAPPDKVFEYVADMPRHSEWAQHDLQVTQTSQGGAGVGTTFASVAHQFGTQRETQTVADYTPGTRFAFDARGSIGTVRHAFDLSVADGGTKVTKSMEISEPSLMARIMAPMIAYQTKKGLAVDLERIKAKLEA
jgi:Polyketide cyclase / dehydrase and lipid transport